jgi:hypothetical protein
MKGDFTRDTFDPSKHYSRVLMQQGRVQLDADWNEQAALMLYQLRTLARDLVGPAWAVGNGFALTMNADADDFSIGQGRFYVDGIACELEADLLFLAQYGLRDSERHWDGAAAYLVYLDAWEQLVTAAEDEALREVALGGADTTARAQIAWQVRLLQVPPNAAGGIPQPSCADARTLLRDTTRRTAPRLSATAKQDAADTPCEIAPDAAYRGPENQLYRVEIHDPGELAVAGSVPTFKWSRDNGAVVFPVLDVDAGEQQLTVKLGHLGRDERSGLSEGDWVELVDQSYLYQELHSTLLRVTAVDQDQMSVTLSGDFSQRDDPPQRRILRRWDQRKGVNNSGVVVLREAAAAGAGQLLEEGVTIRFEAGGQYRTGDYWLIPARTATGDVEWPATTVNGQPQATPQAPHGVPHHYGLLGILAQEDRVWALRNCHCSIPATGLAQCP